MKFYIITELRWNHKWWRVSFDNEGSGDISKKLRYVRLVPVKKYLNKIDKVNSNKLKEHGVKGFAFQIELSQETIDYLNNI